MKNVRQKSYCILQKHCRSTIDPILPVPFSNLDDDIEITAFVPGNDVFPGIDIRLLSWKACLALSCKLGWK